MADMSIRDLCWHEDEMVDRVAAGERITVTRAGRAVAELGPLLQSPLSAHALLERWSRLPALDAADLRADIDSVLDPSS